MANHPVVHVDLPAPDPATSAQFYADALGWEISHDAGADYWMFSTAGGPGGGFVGLGPSSAGGPLQYEIGKPLIYLGSEDIEADLARVEACGGRTILPRTGLGDYGAYAVFADPSGNYLGFYQTSAPTA